MGVVDSIVSGNWDIEICSDSCDEIGYLICVICKMCDIFKVCIDEDWCQEQLKNQLLEFNILMWGDLSIE